MSPMRRRRPTFCSLDVQRAGLFRQRFSVIAAYCIFVILLTAGITYIMLNLPSWLAS